MFKHVQLPLSSTTEDCLFFFFVYYTFCKFRFLLLFILKNILAPPQENTAISTTKIYSLPFPLHQEAFFRPTCSHNTISHTTSGKKKLFNSINKQKTLNDILQWIENVQTS